MYQKLTEQKGTGAVITAGKIAVKGAGLGFFFFFKKKGIAVVGMVGYGVYKLVRFPIDKLIGKKKPKRSFDLAKMNPENLNSAGNDVKIDKEAAFLLTMGLLASPAIFGLFKGQIDTFEKVDKHFEDLQPKIQEMLLLNEKVVSEYGKGLNFCKLENKEMYGETIHNMKYTVSLLDSEKNFLDDANLIVKIECSEPDSENVNTVHTYVENLDSGKTIDLFFINNIDSGSKKERKKREEEILEGEVIEIVEEKTTAKKQ